MAVDAVCNSIAETARQLGLIETRQEIWSTSCSRYFRSLSCGAISGRKGGGHRNGRTPMGGRGDCCHKHSHR